MLAFGDKEYLSRFVIQESGEVADNHVGAAMMGTLVVTQLSQLGFYKIDYH